MHLCKANFPTTTQYLLTIQNTNYFAMHKASFNSFMETYMSSSSEIMFVHLFLQSNWAISHIQEIFCKKKSKVDIV